MESMGDNTRQAAGRLARRIHGWTWQSVRLSYIPSQRAHATVVVQFPIGMGTGAVYVTLSGVKNHTRALTIIEGIFYLLNIALFLVNTTTLLLQAMCTFSVPD